jgi:hypothetical protein
MPRPNKLSATEEEETKMNLIDAIFWNGNRNAVEVTKYLGNLKPFQVRYYMLKFGLSFNQPFASTEDIMKYQLWCIEEEKKGNWLGSLTLPENIPAGFKDKFTQPGHTGRHCVYCGDPVTPDHPENSIDFT